MPVCLCPVIAEHLHKAFPSVQIDVHLMASPVEDLIIAFAKAGATRISIHPEACTHVDKNLALIKSLGCLTGLVLNPATSIDWLTWCNHRLDFVLVMTVNPGFGGQKIIPEIIPKIKEIRKAYPNLPICVDGGIQPDNIHILAHAGASEFVVGSALFSTSDYTNTLNLLHKNTYKPSL